MSNQTTEVKTPVQLHHGVHWALEKPVLCCFFTVTKTLKLVFGDLEKEVQFYVKNKNQSCSMMSELHKHNLRCTTSPAAGRLIWSHETVELEMELCPIKIIYI